MKMSSTKECPLCGGTMRLDRKETVVPVPGHPTPTSTRSAEWVCSDCDYFEEAEEEGT
jgi:C4-type Zn-finger protein